MIAKNDLEDSMGFVGENRYYATSEFEDPDEHARRFYFPDVWEVKDDNNHRALELFYPENDGHTDPKRRGPVVEIFSLHGYAELNLNTWFYPHYASTMHIHLQMRVDANQRVLLDTYHSPHSRDNCTGRLFLDRYIGPRNVPLKDIKHIDAVVSWSKLRPCR